MDTLEAVKTLRRELHQHPEISGDEAWTASRMVKWLEDCGPTQLVQNLGGHGVAAIFDSGSDGPTVMFRCELDALPIYETGTPHWRSTIEGKAHLCGHDGHMAIMAGLAKRIGEQQPTNGKIIILFQPAEETGAGARAVIADPKFAGLNPDYAFALHNLPGMALHHVGVKSGPFNHASEGLTISLSGYTSHACHPEQGLSPATAMTELVTALPNLPSELGLEDGAALVTLVHARLGTEDFGISPGDAKIMATIRAISDEAKEALMNRAKEVARDVAKAHGLKIEMNTADRFSACTNNPEATEIIRKAFIQTNAKAQELNAPYRWSEDFGEFSAHTKSAFFVLGSGEDCPKLHNPNYDFPDEISETGIEIFHSIARDLCG